MKILNIDITNTSIASYALDGAYNEVTLSFSGIPESWQAKLVYATFIQDNLNPTLQVIDGSVEVPSEILASNTDFYVGLYAMTEGETQVEEPTTPVLVVVSATESSEIDVEQFIKTIMKISTTINTLSAVAMSGDYNDLKNKPHIPGVEGLASVEYVNGMAVSQNARISAISESLEETNASVQENIATLDSHQSRIGSNESDITELRAQMSDIEIVTDTINNYVFSKPITAIPTTLEANQKYNFGEVAELSLAFPTTANDGDVIYLTFKSGAVATTLTIDTTNTCDIDVIPEVNTGYEIFGMYNGSIWIINYSEYTVSEG